MSKTVDERVVEMDFDNSKFEKNVRTTMSTLDKFKKALNLDGASKGLNDINEAANSVDFSSIASGVEALEKRFSTMGIVGMTIISRITNSMIDLASKTIGFLTNGVVQGGLTRAMNLQQANFQLQGLLKDEAAVADVMQDVNYAVDGTAYGMDAAAKVASQLAASGMRAGDGMRHALRGVSGVAAMTGSSYEEIGLIFSQVSGQGRLMGDQLLQLSSRGINAAATLAQYLGKTEEEVRDMVSDGKIDFATFAAAMDDTFGEHAKAANRTFTGSMANVKAALARIGELFYSPLIKDEGPLVQFFNTLRERINDVKKAIGPFATAVTDSLSTIVNAATDFLKNLNITDGATKVFNTITDFIKNLNLADYIMSFSNIVSSLINVLKGLWSIIKPIGQAFLDIFPPVASSSIVEFTNKLKDLTSKFKLSAETSEKLKSTFKGLFAVVHIVAQAFLAVVKGVASLFGGVGELSGGILSVTGSFGEFLAKIDETITKSDIFNKIIQGIVKFIKNIVEEIKNFAQTVSTNLNFHPFELFQDLLGNLHKRFEQLIDICGKFSDFLSSSGILKFVQSLWDGIKRLGNAVTSGIGTIMKGVFDGFGDAKFDNLLDIFNTAALGGILVGINKFVKSIKKPLEELGGLKGILNGVTGILDGVKSSLESWQEQLKAGTLMKIASAIGILAVSLLILSSIPSDKLSGSLGALTVIFTDLIAAMAIFSKLDLSGLTGVTKSVSLMIGISVAVLILASALKKLGSLDIESLGKGILGIVALMGSLVVALRLMATDSSKAIKGVGQMILLAIAIKILVSAFDDLSKFSWGELAKGIIGVGVVLLELVGFQALMQLIDTKGMIKSVLSLVVLGVAMEIFANVCSKFANIEWEAMGKGVAALTAVLFEFVSFQALMQLIDTSSMIKSVLSLVTVGIAMEIFADVCGKFSGMDWGSLGKGVSALTVVLLEFVGFQALMQLIDTSSMVKSVLSLVAIGAAMEIFADVCSKFGGMDWGSLGKAGVAITGILALASGFAILAGLSTGIIKSAAALLIMAVALRIFVPVLTILGAMDPGDIAKGLITLAAAFALLGVAGTVLAPVAPAIIALAGAIALIGVGVMAAGVGITLLAVGIGALATAISGGAATIATGLAIIITEIANLIPLVIQKIGEGIVAFCNVIVQGAPAIGEAIKAVLLTTIDVLTECVPQLIECLFTIFIAVLDGLIQYGPEIGEKLFTIVIGFLDFLTEKTPEFVEHVFSLLIAIIDGVASNIQRLVEPIVSLITNVINAVLEAIQPILDFIKEIIIGIIREIAPYLPEISDAIARISEAMAPAIEAIANAFNTLFSQIAPIIDSITGLIRQLGDTICQILSTIAFVISSVGGTICGILSTIGSVFDTIFNGIANVVTSVSNTIRDALDGLANVFDTVFNGISDVVTSVGDAIKSVLDGISGVIDSIGNAALNAGEGFKKLAEGIQIITSLNVVDMGVSLGAVAIALGDISSKSSGLAEAGWGMQQIANGTTMSATAFSAMAIGITSVTSLLSAIGPTATSSMATLVLSVTSSASCFTNMSVAASASSASVIASLSSIGASAASFGGSISALTGAMSSVMSSMVSVVISGSGQISAAVLSMMVVFANTIRSQGAAAAIAFNAVISMMISSVMSQASAFMAAGLMLMTQFKMGLTNGLNGVTSTIQSVLISCSGAIRSYQASFAGAGKDLGQGLVNGINSKQQAAYDAGYALGQAAVKGEKDGQASNSPSKLTIKAGKWIGEGLVIGMDRTAKAVYQSGKSMGANAVDSISNALNKVDSLSSNFDSIQPSISPVVDMSNMNYQLGQLQLGANIDALVSQPVNSLANIMATAQTKIDNSNMEVVSAVNGLRDDLSMMYEADDQEIALYVDAKKLASSIAKPINRQLNIISKREGGL